MQGAAPSHTRLLHHHQICSSAFPSRFPTELRAVSPLKWESWAVSLLGLRVTEVAVPRVPGDGCGAVLGGASIS